MIFSFFDLFGLNYRYVRDSLEKDVRLIELSSSFNSDLTAYYLTYMNLKFFYNLYIIFKKTRFVNISIHSVLNNFYTTNILTRNSNVLTLASKFFTVINDFKYIYTLLEE